MKADETRLKALLGERTQYAVPYFQRSYSWGPQQWKTLWEDILELCESGSPHDHFLGSIVLLRDGEAVEGLAHFLLIDRQQRLVTLCLFLAAVRDAAAEAKPPVAATLHGAHPLINLGVEDEEQLKVLCTYQDRAAFASVITGGAEPPFSAIVDAYRFFKATLKTALERNVDLVRLERIALTQLSFVTITLGPEDNPYRIFESLNAKGMPLTQGDLLRNYFFMRLPQPEHETWHRTVWAPMQTLLGERFDDYMRDALVREGEFLRTDEIYQGWRKRLAPLSTEAVGTVLRELGALSIDYDHVLHPQRESDPAIRKRLERLSLWSNTALYPFRPFLLKIYADYSRGHLAGDALEQILFAVESFLVRQLFVFAMPADDNRLFIELYDQRARESGEGVNFLFWEALSHPQHGWPADGEFREGVERCPLFFRSHPDQRKLILEALEESYPHRRETDYARLHIEFIAPLLPRPDWLAELGGSQELHWRLVGTLGNLTWGVPGRGSLSLAPAERKREFSQVNRYGLELGREVSATERWSATEIESRSRRLAERAVIVWPGPQR